jgi:hypothetical protein
MKTRCILSCWQITAALFGSVFLFPAHLPAQTNVAQTNTTRVVLTRYLFVIDTSEAMRRRAPAVQTAVGNLLRSSMSGRLISGDTVGIWTFNDTLSAGRFPLQRWSPENAGLVASNAVAFIKAQKFTGESKFNVTISTLDRLIKDSERLVILLVTDGNEPIAGTPYDPQIAQAFHQNYAQQQKARMPFITVLQMSRGRMINASVSLAPWPVTIPEFPPEPKIVEAAKPPPEKKEPPRPTVPPLVVIGKKPVVTNDFPAMTNSVVPASEPSAQAAPTSSLAAVSTPSAGSPTRPETVTPTPPALTPSAIVTAEKSVEPQPMTKPDLAPLVATAPADVKPAPAAASSSRTPPRPSSVAAASNPSAQITNSPAMGTAVSSELLLNRWTLAAVGVAFILLAIWFFYVIRQRLRRPERVSLITHSMDRDEK